MASGDRYVVREAPIGLASFGGAQESARSVANIFYEGIVVDVIMDHMHWQHSDDGYNVGAVKVRMLSTDNSLDEELLNWADPMDSTIQEMPLIGELVILNKVMGNFFYFRKVNMTHKLSENGMLNLNSQLSNRSDQAKSQIANAATEITEMGNHQFGQYFRPDSRVRPLKHFEGDILFQGRMGHSIRFGSSQLDPSSKGLAPNIILRTGQAKDIELTNCSTDKVFGLIVEDINNDASSIWMTSDQATPFEPITTSAGSFNRSIKNPILKYDGAQIIINSDRIALASKNTHIMLFANEEIYLNSFKNTSIDTDSNILLSANIDIEFAAGGNIDSVTNVDYTIRAGQDILSMSVAKTSLLADKIFIGSVKDDYEPMVGGTSLSKFLARFIITLLGVPAQVLPWTTSKGTNVPPPTPGIATFAHVITPMGPALLNPEIVGGLVKLYSELIKPNSGQQIPLPFAGAPFNSGDNFVNLGNEVVKIEKNKFKEGKQTKIENNKWLLADPYYTSSPNFSQLLANKQQNRSA